MPLLVKVQKRRGKPWVSHEFPDMDTAAKFMDERAAAGYRVKLSNVKPKPDAREGQGGSERHRDPYRNRRPTMRAVGCCPG